MAFAQLSSATESLSAPADGARLIRAFVAIKDAAVRQKIIDMVEEAAEAGLQVPTIREITQAA
jgi:hypothetical protein